MGTQTRNTPADETSSAGLRPWALSIDLCPWDASALSRSRGPIQPNRRFGGSSRQGARLSPGPSGIVLRFRG